MNEFEWGKAFRQVLFENGIPNSGYSEFVNKHYDILKEIIDIEGQKESIDRFDFLVKNIIKGNKFKNDIGELLNG